MQTGNTDFIYKNELDKACFQHDMAYGKSRDLAKSYWTKLSACNELHRQIIRKFKRRKVYSSFKDNIWGADLADMQSLSKIQKRNQVFILCANDLFSKYVSVVPLKDFVNAFQKIISKDRKPNKIRIDQGGEF